MRHGRAKAARKTLQYFGRTIGLRAPYSILVDATFVAALFQQKILPVKERLDKILQGSPTQPNKYFIEESAVEELRKVHEGLEARDHDKAPVFSSALQWIRKECIILAGSRERKQTGDGDNRKMKLSSRAQEDLLGVIDDSETPFIVASHDDELLDLLRRKGNVPIVRLANNTVLLLENPSKSSQFQAKGAEQQKWRHSLPAAEKALVDLVKKDTTGEIKAEISHARPRVKRAKGPNPLSCKRKQKSDDDNNKESNSRKRRRRTQARNDPPTA